MALSETLIIKADKDVLSNATIRISIDEGWEIDDFILFFDSIKTLYNFYFIYNDLLKIKSDIKGIVYAREEHYRSLFLKKTQYLYTILSSKGYKVTPLDNKIITVDAIKYNSPGYTDITGFAQIIGHIKDILVNYLPNKKTKKEIEILEQERIKLMIENLKSIGLDTYDIQRIVLFHDTNLLEIKQLIENKKITNIEIIKSKKIMKNK